MKDTVLFKTEEGRAFVATTDSRNVQELRRASERYGVRLPDAKYIIIYVDGMYHYYHGLDGYGVAEYAFGVPESNMNQITGQQAEDESGAAVREHALALLGNNLDNMHWGDILAGYLGEEGIEYGEG
ncbi:MAG: hypothetical protein NC307_12215 [Roseburia sp.]|nr:hypothetical protein [Roseburia sp.]